MNARRHTIDRVLAWITFNHAGYLGKREDTPPISFDCVLKTAVLIEQMWREQVKPRREQEQRARAIT